MSDYLTRAARDASEGSGYGERRYWDYLERSTLRSAVEAYRKGDGEYAEYLVNRTLSEALRGNDGD